MSAIITINKGGDYMKKKSVSKNKHNKNNRKHKNNGLLVPGIITGVTAIIIVFVIMVIDSHNRVGAGSDHFHINAEGERYYHTDAEVTSDVDLTIAKSEVSRTVKFYPYKINNIDMEVLAVKSEDGTIRTALNTCVSCYSSSRGYYEQQGDHLVCQNCGNTFELNQIGMQQDGCYPIPIPSNNITDNEDSIVITKTFLASQQNMFLNWRK